jgi:hypothetical protein
MQVTSKDVHAILNQSVQRLEELHNSTKGHVTEVEGNLDAHIKHANQMYGEADQNLKSHIDHLGSSFRQLLDRTLIPVNAYMNTMHVKADTVRFDLDQVSAQVPVLQSRINDVASDLSRFNVEVDNRSTEISRRLDDLGETSLEGFRRSDSERSRLSDTLHALHNALGSRVGELRTQLEDTSQALEFVKYDDINHLGKSLTSLEHRVAQWVHSAPLPAKVSEARLFALEAKMTDEMNYRLQLEEVVKGERTPSRGPLPALPPSRPHTQGSARPRSKGVAYPEQLHGLVKSL